MTTTELIAYGIMAGCWLAAIGMVVVPYLVASPDRRQIGPLAGSEGLTGVEPPEAALRASGALSSDRPLTWPDRALPEDDIRPSDAERRMAYEIRAGWNLRADRALSALARHKNADWSAWTRRSVDGEDVDPGKPWGAGE